MAHQNSCLFNVLENKTLESIVGKEGDEELIFKTTDGKRYKLYHIQDCCEEVYLEDVCGDLSDLIGTPILIADEVCSEEMTTGYGTWTFYKIATNKGSVTLRWLGESNGYYSEGVDFCEI